MIAFFFMTGLAPGIYWQMDGSPAVAEPADVSGQPFTVVSEDEEA
jgi:hypothetical protein